MIGTLKRLSAFRRVTSRFARFGTRRKIAFWLTSSSVSWRTCCGRRLARCAIEQALVASHVEFWKSWVS